MSKLKRKLIVSFAVLLTCMALQCDIHAQNLLLVTSSSSPNSQEQLRITQFQAWGYTVSTIQDSDSQSNYDTALAGTDVVYVSEEVESNDVAYKLRTTTVGVVNEEPCQTEELGFATQCANDGPEETETISIINNTHPITSSLSLGSLTVFSDEPEEVTRKLRGTLAPGLTALGNWGSNIGLAVLETGDTLATEHNGNTTASGRRVFFGLGGSFDFGDFNSNGLSLIQGMLTWAAAGGSDNSPTEAQWLLTETSGTTAADSTSSGLDGTYTNGVTLSTAGPYPGLGATTAEFDGLNDYVDLPDLDMDFSNGFSIAFWFRPSAAPTDYFAMFGISNGQDVEDIWFGWSTGSGMMLYLSDTTDAGATRYLEDLQEPIVDEWQHCVATVDSAGNAKIYRDGVEVANGYISLPTNTNRTENFIGKSSWDDEFPGRMFDVRIYARELTHQEVSDIYGLVGHWTFDEGTGTTAADSTGYANTASFQDGTPNWITGQENGAIEFDGTNTMRTGVDFDPPYYGAVSFWMRSDGVPAGLQRPWGLGQNYEMWQYPDGLIGCDVSVDSETSDFNTTIPLHTANTWYHLVAQYDSATDQYEIYIDGVLHKSGTTSNNMEKQSADQLTFGNRTGASHFFTGAIDDFRIYNRWLHVNEIVELGSNSSGETIRISSWIEVANP